MTTWIAFSEILRNLGLAGAAIVGAILAWRQLSPAASQARAASAQAVLARRAHVTELFNRAVGQLGDDRLEVRLGAVYVLREVARDFPDLARPVFEVLQAYLREAKIDYGDQEPPIDVREIIAILRLEVVRSDDTSSP